MKLIQSKLLKTLPRIAHGFFAPGKGCSKGENFSFRNGSINAVLQARETACGMIGIDHTGLTHVYQTHGTELWEVNMSQRGAGALAGTNQVGEGDAMLTREPGVGLAILAADCIPVFFAAPDGRAVGLAHAGWRGTLDGISQIMAARFKESHGIGPDNLRVWIGPGISSDYFKIGGEVWGPFKEKWGRYSDCFFERDAYYLDLKQLNFHQLIESGFEADHIEISGECSYRNPEIFSYRRDGAGVGHNLAVIEILNQ